MEATFGHSLGSGDGGRAVYRKTGAQKVHLVDESGVALKILAQTPLMWHVVEHYAHSMQSSLLYINKHNLQLRAQRHPHWRASFVQRPRAYALPSAMRYPSTNSIYGRTRSATRLGGLFRPAPVGVCQHKARPAARPVSQLQRRT